MYISSFLITVLGIITYHVGMKKVAAGVNPFLYLMIAYVVAAVFCVPGLFLASGSLVLKLIDLIVLALALGVLVV